MTPSPRPLDLFGLPLEGLQLVEASAGTGKTWTLCGLYVRLLLERGLRVREILVVTFTQAATAELEERVRARLVAVQRALAGGPVDPADPFLPALLARIGDARQARGRIEAALAEFDEAAISTIHAFCQRALAELPFAAARAFELTVTEDDGFWADRAAADFFRRRICAGGLGACHLRRSLAPEVLARALRERLGRPLAEYRFEPISAQAFEAYAADYGQARALWRGEGAGILDRLVCALPGLAKHKLYGEERLREAARELDRYFASPWADFPAAEAERALKLFGTASLRRCTGAGHATPEHPFSALAQALLDAEQSARAGLEGLRIGLLASFLDEAPARVRRDKRERRVAGFDDLLYNLHRALHEPALDWLPGTLAARFPAALIDEFQDTDPLQYEIFHRIYRGVPGPVVLVGDPKQAIYAFRHADLHTYLRAAGEAGQARTHRLETSQRSVPSLVAALNGLFGANPAAFALPGLAFVPVAPSARAREPLSDSVQDKSLVLWALPRAPDGKPLGRSACARAVEAATVAEIGRLLREGRIGGRAVQAQDIAVLVHTHRQARSVKAALAAAGIGAVERSQESVFASQEAAQMQAVLAALADPGDEALLRTALATPVFGLDAAALDAQAGPGAAGAEHVARFLAWRERWQRRGFAPMWRQLLRDAGALRRLLRLPDGERRLTNFSHLAELAQHAGDQAPGQEALLRWLARARRECPRSEAAQLRLESDARLVQIVTVHAAKGLEYPIVFCASAWEGEGREPDANPAQYHEGHRSVVRYAPDNADVRPLQLREAFAEDVRLLYVALTRAVHRVYLPVGAYRQGNSEKPSRRAPLNWLAAGAGLTVEDWLEARGPQLDGIERAWGDFAAANAGTVHLAPLPQAPPAQRGAEAAPPALRARTASRAVEESWRLASFTGLNARVHDAPPADHDERAAAPPAGPAPLELPDDDPLRLPRGAAPGTLLHRVFEWADFSRPETWPDTVARALQRHAEPSAGLARLLEVTLARVCAADLDGAGLRLSEVAPGERLPELEFRFPAAALDASRLARALARAGLPGAVDFAPLSGYLQGAIDCVLRYRGRYWLVDWKSNFLGWRREDYGEAALAAAMAEAGYGLQAGLYGLALHRFLDRRLPDYAPERHFGGVLYLFVRAVRADWPGTGVYAWRPTGAELTAIDECLGAGP